MLTFYVQPGPGRSQDSDVWGRSENLGDQSHALEQVLEIVQDKQHALLT